MTAALASMIVGLVAAVPSPHAATAAPDTCANDGGLLYVDLVNRGRQATPATPTATGIDELPAETSEVSFDRLRTQAHVCPVADFSALSRVTRLEAIAYLPPACLPALARTAKLPALTQIHIACGDKTALDVRLLAAFPALTMVLTVYGCRYGPDGVAPLAALPRLRTFIDGGAAPPEGLEALTMLTGLAFGSDRGAIPSLAKLRTLRAVRLLVGGPADLARLGELPALEELVIISNSLVDVAPLARMTALRYLQIQAYQVEHTAALAGLPGFCRLDVGDVRAPLDIAPVATLKGLRKLAVNVRDGQSLAPLARLRALESLRLIGGCRPSSIDLGPLARLPRLSSVTLQGRFKPAHRARLTGKVVQVDLDQCVHKRSDAPTL